MVEVGVAHAKGGYGLPIRLESQRVRDSLPSAVVVLDRQRVPSLTPR